MESPNKRFIRKHDEIQKDVQKERKLKKRYLYMECGKITAINQPSIWVIVKFWLICKLGGLDTKY